MSHYIDGDNVYFQDTVITQLIGSTSKTETTRIDSETVEDVSYTFDLELGEYVEQSRTTREEPLPPTPPTDADRINELESQLAQTNADLAAVLEMILA